MSAIDASASRSALRDALSSLNLPPGLLPAVFQNYLATDSRIWLVDNSSRMTVRDAHVGKNGRERGTIDRVDGASRWDELQECVSFHCKMASRCWIPTRFWLVNDPSLGGRTTGQEWRHSGSLDLCRGGTTDVADEMDRIQRTMTSQRLDDSRCPLRYCVRTLAKALARDAASMAARDRHATIVICTQGRPTDRDGNAGSRAVADLQREIEELSTLPVRIIVRLCTDTEEVRDMFNGLDVRFDSVDVLDDFWGEALEVYLHNPWLTYTMGLHRLRESGLAPDMMDDLDERPLTLDEIHRLVGMLFLGEDEVGDASSSSSGRRLPHPRKDWEGFLSRLRSLVERENSQWNPVKNRKTPWIDRRKLESSYTGGSEYLVFREASAAPGERRVSSSHRPSPSPQDPSGTYGRRHSHTRTQNPAMTRIGKDLLSVVQRWGFEPPNYRRMFPLPRLLATVPHTFPGQNPAVEPHRYFSKWKMISREAFEEEEDHEGLRELLKRALRKAMYFLNPDHYPRDLTNNQAVLLKSLRNIIRDSEEATLG